MTTLRKKIKDHIDMAEAAYQKAKYEYLVTIEAIETLYDVKLGKFKWRHQKRPGKNGA